MRSHLRIPVLALGLVLALVLPRAGQAQTPDSGVVKLNAIVAVVGQTPITWIGVQERLVREWQTAQQLGRPAPTEAEVRTQIEATVRELVDEELLLAKAKEMELDISETEILSEANASYQQQRQRFATQPEFTAALAEAGLGSPEEFRRFIAANIRRQKTFDAVALKLQQERKLIPPNVTEAELAKEFEELKGSLPRRGASITWRQLVIAPTPTEEARNAVRVRAESIYAELRRGGDFDRIARRESADPMTKDLGGDRGWARRGTYEPQFDALAFGTSVSPPMKPGDFSRPVETPLGIHIYKVERIQPGEVKSRHIFLRPEIDSADVQRAARLADSVVAVIRAGIPFDTLTKRYHDYASREDAGIMPTWGRDSLPLSYSTAFANTSVGDVVTFVVPGVSDNIPKSVVAQVTAVHEGGEMTLAEVRAFLRGQMSQTGAMRRYLDRLQEEIYVVIHLDRAYELAGIK